MLEVWFLFVVLHRVLDAVLCRSFCRLTASLHHFERDGEEVEETFVEVPIEIGSCVRHSISTSRADLGAKVASFGFQQPGASIDGNSSTKRGFGSEECWKNYFADPT
jgi:hypothetical protein